jgi:glycosyltransferase involved in cell wall biosynthesis
VKHLKEDAKKLKKGNGLKIAILGSHGIPAMYGGYETISEELSVGLSRRGFEMYVSCESPLFRPKTFRDFKGVRLVYFPIIGSIRNISEPFLYDLLSVLWFSFRVDIIYMLGYSSMPLLVISKILGKTVVVNADGLEPKRPKFNRVLKFFYRSFEILATKIANNIVVDSEEIGFYYKQRYGLSTTYIPNGGGLVREVRPFGSETLKRFGLEREKYFLVIARLEPDNNIDLIIAGFIRANSDKKLVIIGPLKKSKYVKRLLQMRSEKVIFVGGIYELRLQRTLRQYCFAYIHGHELGGTNPSLLESLSCSNRILALNVPFNREAAENSAIYFEKDIDDLRVKIQTLEKNPSPLPNRHAYEVFERKYSGEKAIEMFANFVKTCC